MGKLTYGNSITLLLFVSGDGCLGMSGEIERAMLMLFRKTLLRLLARNDR